MQAVQANLSAWMIRPAPFAGGPPLWADEPFFRLAELIIGSVLESSQPEP